MIGVDTVSECKLACIRREWCVAIDYDPGNAFAEYCWLLDNTLTAEGINITHYVLDRACAGNYHASELFK